MHQVLAAKQPGAKDSHMPEKSTWDNYDYLEGKEVPTKIRNPICIFSLVITSKSLNLNDLAHHTLSENRRHTSEGMAASMDLDRIITHITQ